MAGCDDDLERFAPDVDLDLDPGIRRAVLLLRRAGVETMRTVRGRSWTCLPGPDCEVLRRARCRLQSSIGSP